jgi:hypothetical protein
MIFLDLLFELIWQPTGNRQAQLSSLCGGRVRRQISTPVRSAILRTRFPLREGADD